MGMRGREEKTKPNTEELNQTTNLHNTTTKNQSTTPGSGEEDRGLIRKFKRGVRIRVRDTG